MTRHIPLERKDAPEITLEDVQKAIEKHAKTTQGVVDEQKSIIEKQADEIKSLAANLLEIEQKLADRLSAGGMPGGGVDGASALAAELVKNPLWSQVAGKQITRTSVEAKASQLLGLEMKNTITGNSPAGFYNTSPGGVYPGLTRRRFIRDFLTTIPVTTGSVAWSKETTFTNNAGVQTDGGSPEVWEAQAKNESVISYTLNETRVPTVAHFVKASNQILADVMGLANLIENRLRYGLNVKTDSLIVNGSGEVLGLTNAANHTVFTPTSGDNGIDSINRAIATLEINEAMATLVLLNPATYRSLQRVKATGGSEEYLFGSPAGQNREAIWNVQVLPTNAVSANKLLVMDVAQHGEFYLREDARVDVGFVNDDFTKNLVTIRAELRALDVTVRKEAVVYGDLTT